MILTRMKFGYIRIRKAGPTEKIQREALKAAGVDDQSATGPMYIDVPNNKTRSVEPKDLTERQKMLNVLRNGNTVVVADFATLAISEWDWLDVLGKISRQGARIEIIDPARILEWDSNIQPVVTELTDTAKEVFDALRSEQTAPARRARVRQGKLGGRPVSVTKKYGEAAWKEAKRRWADPKGGTVKEISEDVGIPVASLNRHLGSMRDARKDTLEDPKSTD